MGGFIPFSTTPRDPVQNNYILCSLLLSFLKTLFSTPIIILLKTLLISKTVLLGNFVHSNKSNKFALVSDGTDRTVELFVNHQFVVLMK